MPHRFCVALPYEKCIWNQIIVVILDGNSVLHVVDIGRIESLGQLGFMQGESTSKIWKAFLKKSFAQYVEFPEIMSVHQGLQFRSEEWNACRKPLPSHYNNMELESITLLALGNAVMHS